MTKIPAVYDKLADAIRGLALGTGSEFNAADVVRVYKTLFPKDDEDMKQIRKAEPGAHSLEGYLDGMLAEYAKGNHPGPSIEWIGPKKYRLL